MSKKKKETKMTTDIVKKIQTPPGCKALADNSEWTNRFEIFSETSDRVYVIAQHKKKGHFGCSCPSWRVRRSCKHLKNLGIPCFEKPYFPKQIG